MAKFKVGDKVEILDGSKIKNYVGGFAEGMYKYIGKTMEIAEINTMYEGRDAYFLKGSQFVWDERGLKLVTDNDKKIVITTDGKTTTAKLYDGKNVIKTAKTKCSPEDKFDFNLGATIALSRLTGYEKKIEKKLDWKAFKASKIAVKVTKDNFKDFVTQARKYGCDWQDGDDYNPFDSATDIFFRIAFPVTIESNELYIVFQDNVLKCSHFLEGEEFIWE